MSYAFFKTSRSSGSSSSSACCNTRSSLDIASYSVYVGRHYGEQKNTAGCKTTYYDLLILRGVKILTGSSLIVFEALTDAYCTVVATKRWQVPSIPFFVVLMRFVWVLIVLIVGSDYQVPRYSVRE